MADQKPLSAYTKLTALPTDADPALVALVPVAGGGHVNVNIPLSLVKALIPALATSAQAKSAASSTIATTPAGVREYLEQYGLASTFTTQLANLNTGMRGQLLNWGGTTANIPVASSSGRGISIPSAANYVTQVGWVNGSPRQFTRFCDNGTWSGWTSADLPAGGAAGQVLRKKSGTDFDVEWAAVEAGDGSPGEGEPSTGGNDPRIVTKCTTALIGFTDTTPSTILSFDVVAGGVYQFDVTIPFSTTATTVAPKFGIDGTAGYQHLTATVEAIVEDGSIEAHQLVGKGGSVALTGSLIGGDNNLCRIKGSMHCTASGTLAIQMASAVQYEYCAAQAGASGILTKVGTITVSP